MKQFLKRIFCELNVSERSPTPEGRFHNVKLLKFCIQNQGAKRAEELNEYSLRIVKKKKRL